MVQIKHFVAFILAAAVAIAPAVARPVPGQVFSSQARPVPVPVPVKQSPEVAVGRPPALGENLPTH